MKHLCVTSICLCLFLAAGPVSRRHHISSPAYFSLKNSISNVSLAKPWMNISEYRNSRHLAWSHGDALSYSPDFVLHSPGDHRLRVADCGQSFWDADVSLVVWCSISQTLYSASCLATNLPKEAWRTGSPKSETRILSRIFLKATGTIPDATKLYLQTQHGDSIHRLHYWWCLME